MTQFCDKNSVIVGSLNSWLAIVVAASILLFSIMTFSVQAHESDTASLVADNDVEFHLLEDTNIDIMNQHGTDHDMHGMECMSFQCHAMAVFEFSYLHHPSSRVEKYLSPAQVLLDATLSGLIRPPRHV